jgi:hypothetical protein
LNCTPYVELQTSKGPLKFLIDSGANKNYIKPCHVKNVRNCHSDKTATVHNVNGQFLVDRYTIFNPFPESKTALKTEFFILDFHKFFDGLLGWEYLQQIESLIDAGKHTLILPDLTVKMKRRFPNKVRKELKLHAYETKIVQIDVNNEDGDFLLTNDCKIQENVYINPGLYRVADKKCYVEISNYNKQNVAIRSPSLKVNLNNFETEVINAQNFSIKPGLLDKIRFSHLNAEERRLLFHLIAKYQNCFHLDHEDLTFTNDVKHEIKTTDEVPI